jgi:hypothetical protein
MQALKRWVLGADGRLRPLWRAILFYAVGTFVVFPLLGAPIAFAAGWLHPGSGLSAGSIALGEFRNFLTALICTGAFALYERRRIDSYGLPVDCAFGFRTFEGAAAGVVMEGLPPADCK